MVRDEFIENCNRIEKLIRTEFGYSQEIMAHTLGISKKTLVEIEKGRSSLGWTASVALCTLFADSEVAAASFGGNPQDLIQALAFTDQSRIYPKTMGGYVWWKDLNTANGYRLQQNLVSKHYRILDGENRRVASSFDYGETLMHFNRISMANPKGGENNEEEKRNQII